MSKHLRASGNKKADRIAKPKKKKAEFEIMLKWKKGVQPFIHQKLLFKHVPAFNKAFQEAVAIKDLLVSVGGFDNKAVKIVGFAYAGILDEYQNEHRFAVKKKKEDMQRILAEAKTVNNKKKDSTKTKPREMPSSFAATANKRKG